MTTERSTTPTHKVLGVDHSYITVSDLDRAEAFYDDVMQLMGFPGS